MPFDPASHDALRAKVAKIRERLQSPPPGATEAHRKEAERVLYDLESQLADQGRVSSDLGPQMSLGFEEAGRASIEDPDVIAALPGDETEPESDFRADVALETQHAGMTFAEMEQIGEDTPPLLEGSATGKPELWAAPEVKGKGAPYFWEEPSAKDARGALEAARQTAQPIDRVQIDKALLDLAEFGEGSDAYRRFADVRWQLVSRAFRKLGRPAVRVKYAEDKNLLGEAWKALKGEGGDVAGATYQAGHRLAPLALGVEEGMTAGLGRELTALTMGALEPDEISELREAGVLPPIEEEFRGMMERHPAARVAGGVAGLAVPGAPLGRLAGAAGGRAAAAMGRLGTGLVGRTAQGVAGGMGAGATVAGTTEVVSQAFGDRDPDAVVNATAEGGLFGGLFGGLLGGLSRGVDGLRSSVRKNSRELAGIELFEEAGGSTSMNPIRGGLNLPKAAAVYERNPLSRDLLTPEARTLRDAARSAQAAGATQEAALSAKAEDIAKRYSFTHEPLPMENTVAAFDRIFQERLGVNLRQDAGFQKVFRQAFPNRMFPSRAGAIEAGYDYKIVDLGEGKGVIAFRQPKTTGPAKFEQEVAAIEELAKYGATPGEKQADPAFKALTAAILRDRRALYGEEYAALRARQAEVRTMMEQAKRAMGMAPSEKFDPTHANQFESVFNRLRQYSSGASPTDATIREFLSQDPAAMQALSNYAALKHYNQIRAYGTSQYASSDIAPTLERKGIARMVARLPLVVDATLREAAPLLRNPRAGGTAALNERAEQEHAVPVEDRELLDRMVQLAKQMSQEQ